MKSNLSLTPRQLTACRECRQCTVCYRVVDPKTDVGFLLFVQPRVTPVARLDVRGVCPACAQKLEKRFQRMMQRMRREATK